MHVISKVIITAVLLISVPASAKVVKRYTDGSATAKSEHEAKVMAVIDAAGKAFGIDLNVKIDSSLEETSVSDNNQSNSNYIQSINRKISQSINIPDDSPITGYSVNDLYQQADGRWRADITIEYAWFEQLGATDDRRTMVIVGGLSHFEKSTQQALQQALVGERRFNILERDLGEVFKNEEKFIKSSAASPEQIARLGRGLGADYLVSVYVDNIYATEDKTVNIEASGESYKISEVDFDYRVKVIEFSSREVKLVLSDRFHKTGRDGSDDGSVLSLINNFGKDVAQQITSSIYPMRLTLHAKGQLIVNRGRGVLKVGQRLNAYKQGDIIYDPDNGEYLDSLEEHIGVLVVKDVKPKYSIVAFTKQVSLPKAEDYVVRFISLDETSSQLEVRQKEKAEKVKKKTRLFLQ